MYVARDLYWLDINLIAEKGIYELLAIMPKLMLKHSDFSYRL